jgi:hypothetical protein
MIRSALILCAAVFLVATGALAKGSDQPVTATAFVAAQNGAL